MGEGNGKELEVLTIKHWYSSVMDECASCMAIGAVVLLVVMSITTMIPSLSSACLLLLPPHLIIVQDMGGQGRGVRILLCWPGPQQGQPLCQLAAGLLSWPGPLCQHSYQISCPRS